MKVRIDIVCGADGSGKSTLIQQITAAEWPGGRVYVCQDESGAAAGRLAWEIRRNRPARVLLESGRLLEDFRRIFQRDDMARLGFAGTRAFVLDAARFTDGPPGLRAYCERQIRHADVVFVNRADALLANERLAVLARIWELNSHVQLMVEPLGGIDLWRVLDLPFAPEPAQPGTKIYRIARSTSCLKQNSTR